MSSAVMATTATSAARSLWRTIRQDVTCVHQRDPAARNTFEVALLYPGVHAIIWHRLAHRLWNANSKFLARSVSFLARFLTNVDIHPGAAIGERFFIDHGAGVVIGETAVVGDDVTLYHGVTLGGSSWSPGKRHPTVEDGVLIGAGAKILGNITIGRNARIGANSVIIEDVAPEATIVGIPGRLVRKARRGSGPDGRIDLEHHLIPDPVADAMAILIDRIGFLEARLSHLQQRVGAGAPGKTHRHTQHEEEVL
jgi:serine O-acetyltransferase